MLDTSQTSWAWVNLHFFTGNTGICHIPPNNRKSKSFSPLTLTEPALNHPLKWLRCTPWTTLKCRTCCHPSKLEKKKKHPLKKVFAFARRRNPTIFPFPQVPYNNNKTSNNLVVKLFTLDRPLLVWPGGESLPNSWVFRLKILFGKVWLDSSPGGEGSDIHFFPGWAMLNDVNLAYWGNSWGVVSWGLDYFLEFILWGRLQGRRMQDEDRGINRRVFVWFWHQLVWINMFGWKMKNKNRLIKLKKILN